MQLLTSSLGERITSHLQSLGVASADIHRLLDSAANISTALPGDDDVTAMTSRLVDEIRQVVANISTTPISADHVTDIYRTAETGRQIAEMALNATQHAVYNIYLSILSYFLNRLK